MDRDRFGILQGPDVDRESFLRLYKQHELVIIKRFAKLEENVDLVDHLRDLHASFPQLLDETFNVESTQSGSHGKSSSSSSTTLTQMLSELSNHRPANYYISVIVQDDQSMLDKFFKPMPFSEPHPLGLFHDNCAWFFLGNAAEHDGVGRSEHRDFIASSGSWHLQLRSTKVWHVRRSAQEEAMEIPVEAGDMIFINTYVWLHRTVLKQNAKEVNASVARDFWIEKEAFLHAQGPENSTSVHKTNVDNPWAKGDVEKGEVVFVEEAKFIVQDADELGRSTLCQTCFQPTVDRTTARQVTEGKLSRFALIQKGLSEGVPIVDEHTRMVFCSKQCQQKANSRPSVDPSKKDLFYHLLQSGHFEVLFLACCAFLRGYDATEHLLPSLDKSMDTGEPSEMGRRNGEYIMHEASVEDLPFRLSQELKVVKTNVDSVCVGLKVVSFADVPVSSLEELDRLVYQANEQRKELSANATGFQEFDWKWTGLPLAFDQPIMMEVESVTRRKWVQSTFALLVAVASDRAELMEQAKRRFEKLELLFRYNTRRVGEDGLNAYYEVVSKIPVGSKCESNCRVSFGQGPNRPASIIATKRIPEGQDFILLDGERDFQYLSSSEADQQEYSSDDAPPLKKPRNAV